MAILSDLLDGDQAAKLTALLAELVTEPGPAPAAFQVCRECGQQLPRRSAPAAAGSPAGVPAALFRAPEVDEEAGR